VNGSFNIRDATENLPCFWTHDDTATCDVLATSFGANLAWTEGAVNTLRITYGPGQVKVERVGSVATTTVFDVTGVFPTGRVGLYNYSQGNVTYAVNDLADPANPTTTTTTPTTLPTTSTTAPVATTTTVLTTTIARTGPDTAATIQLTAGALLIAGGALMVAVRGKRPLGRHFS
jgi:hypothetical protein